MTTSLNGDTFVMRNGRSTSQVSIYNYPEHLNPFYEDDQHKRLRFWQIKKSAGSGSGSRRNSFSLGGLKDVWAFKSFRLKKKSSTLGINKTSESPPPLRRDQQQYYTENDNNNLSFPDYRTRYSTPVGNDSFQRNAVYRSSLQNVASSKDNSGKNLDFNRNNQYRSTIQVMGTKSSNNNNKNINSLNTPVPQTRRYVYGGSVTPQPHHRNSDIGAGVGLSHGSSQISMASTNPFDTDDDYYEENNEDVSLAGVRNLITSTPIKKQMHRKKRRAPPPPPPVRGATNASSSTNFVSDSSLDGTLPPQPLPELRIEECMDIANLTAAIESFVKTTNEDVAEGQHTTTGLEKQNGEVRSLNAAAQESSSELTTKTNEEAKIQQAQSTNTTATTKTNSISESNIDEAKELVSPETTNNNVPKEVGHVECIHVHMENARTTSSTSTTSTEHAEPSQFTSFRGNQTRSTPEQPPQMITTKTSFTLTTPPITRRSSAKKSGVVALPNTETAELKITEDVTEAAKKPTTQLPDANKPVVLTKPHIAEIHKPAKGVTSTSAAAAVTSENETTIYVGEMRQAPLSPVPPVRHSTSAKLRQAQAAPKVQPNEIEVKLAPNNTSMMQQQALTITESREDLLLDKNETATSTAQNSSTTTTNSSTTPSQPPHHRTQSPPTEELREEALESLYRPKPTTSSSYMEWKQTTLAPLEKNVPPEKRKSVKDIIESINRSQRLLNAAAHKETTAHNGSSLSISTIGSGGGGAPDTPMMRRKFSNPSVIERNLGEIQQKQVNANTTTTTTTAAVQQIEDEPSTSSSSAIATNQVDSNTNGANDDGGEHIQEEDPQKLNNNEIFKKCIVKKDVQYDYREQSPTTSNLDWNPVPKPKRNKNIAE